jgi:cold shock CspA family protein
MSSAEQVTMPLSERLIGQVKWFNNKAGYGFVTVRDGEYADKDIFAHYSALRVTTSQYKYLMEGEYVEFDLVKTEGGKHEYQATDISGIKGGGLMCETRNANRQVRESESETRPEATQRRYRVRDETEGDRRPERRVSRDPRSDANRTDASNRRPRKNPTPSESN